MVHGLETIRQLNGIAVTKLRPSQAVSLVVVNDCDLSQCLYVDGQQYEHTDGPTVYACDLEAAAAGRLIDLQQEEIDFVHDEWPARLEDALKP